MKALSLFQLSGKFASLKPWGLGIVLHAVPDTSLALDDDTSLALDAAPDTSLDAA